MSTQESAFDAKLFLPDNKEFSGKLIFTDVHHIVEFKENPYGHMSAKPIPVVFCEAENKKFTLVHCILLMTTGKKSSYVINELYEGDWFRTGLESDYEAIVANCLFRRS
jgi:hypothetical protein